MQVYNAAVIPQAVSTGGCGREIENISWISQAAALLNVDPAIPEAYLFTWAGFLARFTFPAARIVPIWVDLEPWGR